MKKHANISIFVPHEGCPNQCSFCNQRYISGQQTPPTPEDAAKICEEALKQGKNFSGSEIAFFGGSFTAIDHTYMEALLQAVQPYVGEGKFSGIRISTRPDAINAEVLKLLLSYHVTAIELGVQSMDDSILERNRRGHTAAHVERAVALIRTYPFELGLQFMPGLLGDSTETIRKTAASIADLKPDTVRIYPTLVLENTELACLWKKGEYQPLSLEQAVELSVDCIRLFEDRNIRVIRVGLHASETMEAQLLAGPYHPAFRELCESRLYYENALSVLEGKDKSKPYHLFTAPEALSKTIGQGSENLRKLRAQGYNIKIKPQAGLTDRQLKLTEFLKEGRGKQCN